MTETPFERRLREPGPRRLLALDGGGIRGLITLGYLARIEGILRRRYGKDDLVLADYFDLIGGTSTGSIIATLLALGHPVARIYELYRSLGREAFQARRSWLGPIGRLLHSRYQDAPIEKLLKDFLGETTLSSPTLKVGLLIVTKRADTGSVWCLVNVPDQKFFELNKNLRLWEVIRSSTAAPTYFDPRYIADVGAGEEGVFVDGSVSMHNNPALQLLMIAAIEGFGLSWPLGEDRMLLCSVGTGTYSKLPRREELRRYNNLQWLALLVSQLMNDASELNETILQWISRSPTARSIDLQIGTLAGKKPGGAALLHYLRYDIEIERQALSKIGLQYEEARVKELCDLGEVKNVADLEKIGATAAAASVKEDHFPAAFDRRPAEMG
jgi:hypothetical protein